MLKIDLLGPAWGHLVTKARNFVKMIGGVSLRGRRISFVEKTRVFGTLGPCLGGCPDPRWWISFLEKTRVFGTGGSRKC